MSETQDEADNQRDLDRDEWTDAERQAEHKIRMRFEYRDLIEDLIQDGQDRGVFDNLSGKGKPLDLGSNLYEGDRKLANQLMKEHDVVPPWLARRSQAAEAADELRQDFDRRWRRHEQAYRLVRDDGRRKALALSWRSHCRRWEAEIVEVNTLVDEFNLRRPINGMELIKLRLNDELKRVGARRELAGE